MISTAIVSRYANALVDVVTGPKGLDPKLALANLQAFNALVESSEDLRKILDSPAVSSARKRIVIKKFAEMLGIEPIICNFLLVLSDHRRAAALIHVIERFEVVMDERMGFLRADVKSAGELSETQRQSLSEELSKLAGKAVQMRFEIDPELIGGVTAQLGSTVYDGSVRGQLNTLRSRFS